MALRALLYLIGTGSLCSHDYSRTHVDQFALKLAYLPAFDCIRVVQVKTVHPLTWPQLQFFETGSFNVETHYVAQATLQVLTKSPSEPGFTSRHHYTWLGLNFYQKSLLSSIGIDTLTEL